MTSNRCPLRYLESRLAALAAIFASISLNGAYAQSIRIVTTTPDIAWMAKEIGQDKVETISLLNGSEDPHYVDARPDYVTRALQADVVCIVGLGLETSWINRVLAKTGKQSIQPGGKGYCELGKRIEALDKPTHAVDRSQGDIHPEGNPHFWLSHSAFFKAGQEITDTLIRVDTKNAESFLSGYERLQSKLMKKRDELKQKILSAGITGKAAHFLEYHKEFAYFAAEYGLQSNGTIEEKPGVSPSARRIASVALLARGSDVSFALASNTAPRKILTRFEELSGVPVLILPLHVQTQGKWTDYIDLQEHIVQSIIDARVKTLSKFKKVEK